MPDTVGLRIPEMLDAAVEGKLKAMYVMGEDPALTDADANHVRRALDALDFLVVQNIFMTETATYADVFLPAALYAEKDGHVHQHRAPRAARAQGGGTAGRVPCGLGDHPRPGEAARLPDAVHLA